MNTKLMDPQTFVKGKDHRNRRLPWKVFLSLFTLASIDSISEQRIQQEFNGWHFLVDQTGRSRKCQQAYWRPNGSLEGRYKMHQHCKKSSVRCCRIFPKSIRGPKMDLILFTSIEFSVLPWCANFAVRLTRHEIGKGLRAFSTHPGVPTVKEDSGWSVAWKNRIISFYIFLSHK